MDIKPIQQLLETEMDRKEFLSYVAVLILAVTGITALTKSLAPPEKQSGPKSHKAGYGGSAYGG